MHVRHAAWLNAAPESLDSDKGNAPKKPRREALKKGDEDLEMPPCEAPYLVGYLFEIGPTMAAGMGASPLTHGEIESWQRNTGISLNTWEVRTLKRLSLDYLGESQRAIERGRPAPWADAPYLKYEPDRVAASLKASMYELKEL